VVITPGRLDDPDDRFGEHQLPGVQPVWFGQPDEPRDHAHGFSLGSLTLGQTGGQTVTMGSFLQLTGAVLTATNFAVTVDGSRHGRWPGRSG